MPQESNFNVSPYFDDFDKDKDFYKVLFKPGYPIQARELTTLQSILQNQVEQFGSHFFKEGAKVIPGNWTYDANFYAVEINETFSGIPVSLYLDNLVGLKIYGRNSGVRAQVLKVLNSLDSEKGNVTLYVYYLDSSSNDFSKREFEDNEVLVCESSIQFGNTFISANEGFASTIVNDSTSVGSAFSLTNGVYFIRGTFVSVENQTIILDQYSNKPSYRIGLLINEEIVTHTQDKSLVDNSQGYSNYSAPGADRFKLTATLFKKNIDDYDDKNFIQLAQIENGILREVVSSNVEYNIFGDELARRTFDESGHYYVRPFSTYCRETLNNGRNNGLYNDGQLTTNGNVPSKDLFSYKVSPGKAYVKGYEVEVQNPVFLDAPKPRKTKTAESQSVNFQFTPTLSVNNVTGSPLIGISSPNTISLRDRRVGSNAGIATGTEIGVARCYDFVLEQGGYDFDNSDRNIWDLSLFDIQTYSTFTLNESITLSTPTYIKGNSTGATGYLKNSVANSNIITVYQINGEFSEKESITFDDSDENKTSRYIVNIKNYTLSDVKSVFSNSSGITFSADTIQSELSKGLFSSVTITGESSGISTVTVSGSNLSGLVYEGNIIKYSQPGISTISYARVENVSYQERYFTISPVENVDQVVYGNLPSSEITVNNLSVLTTRLQKTQNSGNAAGNYSLYSALPKRNISSVDLSDSQLTIRRQYSGITITDGSTGPIGVGYENSVFLPFDEERYILIRSDGTLEKLTRDKFQLTEGSTVLTINNLSSNDSGAILIASIRKNKITSKIKKKKLLDSIIVDKSSNPSSGSQSSTLNDGLVYGNYPYGTRIQDKEICLNYPDVFVIYGIFESNNSSTPSAPSLNISSLDGPSNTTNDLIIGESFVGRTSGARGFYIERKTDSTIDFIYENQLNFINGEIITFTDSKVNGLVVSTNSGSKNITENYILNSGQNPIYYDYSRIIRNNNSPEPKGKIKVYFSRGYYDSSDLGDITTANSYGTYIFDQDVSTISNIRLTDLIDFRPRVDDYIVSEDQRSPFEFIGRSFNHSNHSSKDIISSDDSLIITYSYYLPRIDRIYLSKDKTLSVKFGNPDDNPSLPDEVSGSMNIANIYLPPYLYRAEDAKVEFVQHKRYQMRDIFNLENRIKNLEQYTTLSLLESDTENFFVDDGTGTGANRFKSGFFVDNFSTVITQNISIGVKNSIDSKKNQLRPSHYTTILPLETSTSEIGDNLDKRYSDIIGSNIKRSDNVVTLDYSEMLWLRQPFATRTENVTPFFAKTWEGSMQLYPTVDVWIDVNRMESNDVVMEGSFRGVAESVQAEISSKEDGARMGVSAIQWGSWEVTGIDLGTHQTSDSSTSVSQGTAQRAGTQAEFEAAGFSGTPPDTFRFNQATETTTTVTTTNTFLDLSLNQQRSGKQYTVTEEIDTASFGDRIAKRSVITFMRSRNIEFTSRGMKPYTQVYPFFDSVDVYDFCCSKLLEIQMTSGTFEVGETVVGQFESEDIKNSSNTVSFRVAVSNHKYGPYNEPFDTFDRNPYDRQNRIPQTYSTTSTILNIDTFSLADNSNGEYFGVPKKGMILRGLTSGAQAIVSDVRIVTDRIGTILGSFLVPSEISGTLRFETGRSRFRLTNSPVNSQIEGVVTTFSEETFYSQGDLDTKQETTLSLRNARVSVNDEFRDTPRTLSDSTLIDSETTVSSTTTSRDIGYVDPLAQTFFVDDVTGVYLSKVDVFFATKAEVLPVTLQIRETTTGIPNSRILPFSEVELTPDKINVSIDASARTSFNFETPVYLEPNKEYAIVLISNTDEYTVWISTFGQFDVSTLERESGRALVSTQPLLGSFFRSQNASTWEPDSYSDLTFELFRADFQSSGFIEICNSNLPEKMELMSKNPLTLESNKIKVSLSSTITNQDLSLGNTVVQNPEGLAQASGKIVGYYGSVSGNLNITNSGVGYQNGTYNSVSLISVNGEGVDATANIVVSGGEAISATIVNGGSGYVIGEILEPLSLGDKNLGLGVRFSVSNIFGRNGLIIDNIQGEFSKVSTDIIKFVNSSGITTDFSNDGSELSISTISTITDGEHFKVFHRNHGMHSPSNSVILRDLGSDIDKVPLAVQYPSPSGNDGEITISGPDISYFETFEGAPVGTGNRGYVRILDEILSYTGTNGNTLTGVSRQIDGTKGFNYSIGTLVEKYELNGVSLRRINKTHNLNDVSLSIKEPIGADYYYLKIDTSSNGNDRSVGSGFGKLKFNKTINAGGSNGKATYNIPFEMVIPNIKQTIPVGTNIKSTIRTVSGTSLGGNEVSFVDMGYQDVSNNSITYFDSPRIVASKINETNNLFDLPRNKSINMNIYMSTIDTRISPTLDLSDINLVLTSNRINSPIIDYTSDPRVNTLKEDPNLFTYTSNLILLDNPATSIKVVLDAYLHNESDIRLLYSTGENNNEFTLFPGSSNINPDNQTIISLIDSDGSADSKMIKQDIYTHTPNISNFNQYEFTANLNYEFKYFRIKMIGTSKTQSYVPIIKNLRILALA